jgi:hypothetical protein
LPCFSSVYRTNGGRIDTWPIFFECGGKILTGLTGFWGFRKSKQPAEISGLSKAIKRNPKIESILFKNLIQMSSYDLEIVLIADYYNLDIAQPGETAFYLTQIRTPGLLEWRLR